MSNFHVTVKGETVFKTEDKKEFIKVFTMLKDSSWCLSVGIRITQS